jgi:hypothetical protein
MYAKNASVKMTIFVHENFMINQETSSKTLLYKDNKLIFMGDGYKAITMLIRNVEDPEPVKKKFHAQLSMREKPKFSKEDDIEKLRREALEQHALVSNKKKRR